MSDRQQIPFYTITEKSGEMIHVNLSHITRIKSISYNAGANVDYLVLMVSGDAIQISKAMFSELKQAIVRWNSGFCV